MLARDVADPTLPLPHRIYLELRANLGRFLPSGNSTPCDSVDEFGRTSTIAADIIAVPAGNHHRERLLRLEFDFLVPQNRSDQNNGNQEVHDEIRSGNPLPKIGILHIDLDLSKSTTYNNTYVT